MYRPIWIARHLAFVICGIALASQLTACKWVFPSIGYNTGYQPDQPIAFSHELHAGQNKIQCLYCHSNAERANNATVPSLNICMNCHMVVATDKPAIQQIQTAYAEGKTINWVKVHKLPDFVHFNHRRHIKAGVACSTCHGPVETMKQIRQVSDLSMGWCVNCHRKPENNAPVSCSTCHY
jgi:hypothetical protein